jgi:hypothetical protein
LDVGLLVAFHPAPAAGKLRTATPREQSMSDFNESSQSSGYSVLHPATMLGRAFTLSHPLDAPRPVDLSLGPSENDQADHPDAGFGETDLQRAPCSLAAEVVVWCGRLASWPLGVVATRCVSSGRVAVWALRRLRADGFEDEAARTARRSLGRQQTTGSGRSGASGSMGYSGTKRGAGSVPRGWRSIGDGDSIVRLATSSILQEIEVTQALSGCVRLLCPDDLD